jgi:hypothetical protein
MSDLGHINAVGAMTFSQLQREYSRALDELAVLRGQVETLERIVEDYGIGDWRHGNDQP